MNNKAAVAIVGAIIILGAGAYFVFGNKKDADYKEPNEVQSQNQTAQPEQQAVAPQSLKELQAKGSPTKCTFSDSGSQGTFYVASGKARGDFSTTSSGQTSMSHMILDGQTTYVWMDGQTQGFKTTIDASAQSSVAPQQGIDPNKKVDYSCSSWSADASVFSPPASVQFMDMGSLMKPQ